MEKRHTILARFLHWGFIILYSYGIFKQIDELSQLEDTGLLIFEVIFASLFLVIVLIRYFYMRRFETFLGASEPVHIVHKYFAKTIHTSMYACLILLPLTGLMIAGLFTQGYTDEDGILISSILGVHEFSATLSYILIATHIAAAIYSRIKGEGIWSAMVPLLNNEKPTSNEIIIKISTLENKIYDKVEDLFTPKKE